MKLLVIDIQKGITDDRLYNFEQFVENSTRIIKEARSSKAEVIYIQHDDGPNSGFTFGDEDFEISKMVEPLPNEKVFTKKVCSCFSNSELVEYLKDESELMIIGLQTNFCIDASVKSAFERGYKVIIPEGTNSTFDNDYMSAETTYNYYNNMMWPGRFASCVTLDEAISILEN